MTDRLFPTPTRLRILDATEAGCNPPSNNASYCAELVNAGWLAAPTDADAPWTVTPLGHAIRDVRIHEREDGRHIVAETGDGDEPRVLGDANKSPSVAWYIRVGNLHCSRPTKHEAREELRHMAATLLAAETPPTVQEGHP